MNNHSKQILNYITLIGVLVALIQTILFIFVIENRWMALFYAIFSGIHGFLFFINKYGKHQLAKTIYFLVILPAISGLDWLVNHQIDIHLYYIPISLFILMMNDIRKDRFKIVVYFFLSLISYVLFEFILPNPNIIRIPIQNSIVLYNINFGFSIFISLLSAYYFVLLNKKKEDELIEQNTLHQTFFNSSPDALFLVQVETKDIISWNQLAKNKFFLEEKDKVKYYQLFDLKENTIENFWNKVENYLSVHCTWSQEIVCKTSKGDVFLGEVFIKQFDLVGVPNYLIRISDLSKKEIERENQRIFLNLKKQVNQEIDRRENLKLILQGQENERHRISQELHDGLGQILTATRLKVASLKYKDHDNFYEDKKQIKDLMDKVIAEIKLISNNLMPTGLEDLGLIDALENTFSLFPDTIEITFDYAYSIKNVTLSQNQNIGLFRIIQEAVNNAIKHSKTTKIFVCIGLDESNLFVEVYDYGVGFDWKNTKLLSNGINNMKERASLINATFELESIINKGTKITLLLNVSEYGED
jgi:signal transduction histidine kinase